jgi:hypothetical protein
MYDLNDIHVGLAPLPLPSPVIRTSLVDTPLLKPTPAVLLAVLFQRMKVSFQEGL